MGAAVPPAPSVPQAVASDEWDHPSAVIKRAPSRPSMPELELDLDDLGPASTPLGQSAAQIPPNRRGKAEPISLRPAPPPAAPAARPAAPAAAPRPQPNPSRSSTSPQTPSSLLGRQSSVPSAHLSPTTRPPPPEAYPEERRSNPNATTVPRHAPISRPQTGARPTAPTAPSGEGRRWDAGQRPPVDPVRHTMPTLMEEDPLAFDLHDDLGSPERVSFPDDLGVDLDELRDPKMRQPPLASEPPISSNPEPHTAPYPIDEHRFQSPPAVGQFRPTPSSAAPHTIDGVSELLDDDTLLGPPPIPRAPLMGDRPPANPQERALREMRDKFALGDFSGALKAAESILEGDSSHAEAARYADNCRARLRSMYEAKLGSLSKVPRVILPPDQVRWLSLDHRAGFVLSCVDGYSTIEEILDVSGMSTLDALRILHDLMLQKVIAVP